MVGGGTAGPVMPLLAVAEILKEQHPTIGLVFIGGRLGPERELAESAGISYEYIPTAKWRRYFSLKNIYDLLILPIAVMKSLIILKRRNVKVVVNAGSYVGVPVVWAAWLMRRKILIHHQDVQISLSTRLTRALADIVTLVFPEARNYIPEGVVVGNAIRAKISAGDPNRGADYLGIKVLGKTVMIFGGGTGASSLNAVVEAIASDLINRGVQVIHITGRGKEASKPTSLPRDSYVKKEFLSVSEMADAYALADLVVCRAGMGTISELSYLVKPAIIIPLPESHQEKNAAILSERDAAVVLSERSLNADSLKENIFKLLDNSSRQKVLCENIKNIMQHDAATKISVLVYKLLGYA